MRTSGDLSGHFGLSFVDLLGIIFYFSRFLKHNQVLKQNQVSRLNTYQKNVVKPCKTILNCALQNVAIFVPCFSGVFLLVLDVCFAAVLWGWRKRILN